MPSLPTNKEKKSLSTSSWNRFFHNAQKDVKLWLFCFAFLLLFRIVFIFLFRLKLDPATQWPDILSAVLNGMRYDSVVATVFALVPFFLSVKSGFRDGGLGVDRVRGATGSMFVVLATISCVLTIGYFREYNDQFNHFIFNLYYDDTKAILLTIWADYHPLANLTVVGVIVLLALKVKDRLIQNAFAPSERLHFPFYARVVTVVLLVVLVFGGIRGSLGRRPMQRKDAAVTRDDFLNKTVPNPLIALFQAVQDHAHSQARTGIEAFLPDKDIRKAARTVFGDKSSPATLDDYMKKIAAGPRNSPARQIFLFVMESYDGWPLLDQYRSLRLAENLRRLGKEGLQVRNFLPASDGTMESLATLMTGLPYAAVQVNYQDSSRKAYPSSLAETFRRLGYRTRLFYGGYLSWQRFGEFAKAQGFDEVYGAPHMGNGATTYEWGVDDEYLFNFILKTADDARPSFNLVMSTSFHPPYRVDVFGKGYSVTSAPEELISRYDGSVSLKVLGHLWYADKCLGDFVRSAEKRLRHALFAVTGDHFGRKFINGKPDFFEQSVVPFVLYGKDVLKGISLPPATAGSHLDIGPTLIELAAPKGFSYYSVGSNLLGPRGRNLGVRLGKVMGPDYIMELSSPPKFHPVPGRPLPEKLPDVEDLKTLHNSILGIGWWRVKQGPEF